MALGLRFTDGTTTVSAPVSVQATVTRDIDIYLLAREVASEIMRMR